MKKRVCLLGVFLGIFCASLCVCADAPGPVSFDSSESNSPTPPENCDAPVPAMVD